MNAIQESQWGQVSVYTWSDLTPHQWECFRLALMNVDTEQLASGVAVEYSNATNIVITEVHPHGVKVVQSPIIVEAKSEMVVNIVVSERDYKTEMIKSLPLYERKSGVFNEIINANDREFRNVEQQLEVVERNMFVDTAVESLTIYERDLGIEPLNLLSYKQRREQITSRNRAVFDQTTEETIKSVASAYSNGDAEVNPTDVVGVYEIKFIGAKGIPDNIEGLQKAIDIIVPAHLEFTYTYTYNPWEFIKDMTWGGVNGMTWNELRTWNEVS